MYLGDQVGSILEGVPGSSEGLALGGSGELVESVGSILAAGWSFGQVFGEV